MKKVIALAALAAIALVPTLVKANEKHETTTHEKTTTTTVEAKHETLKDGTKISIEGDHVYVVASDGAKTAAPDGEHELSDGTKVKTHGGVIVK